MAVLHEEMPAGACLSYTEKGECTRPINDSFARFLNVANRREYLLCAAFLVSNGAAEECAVKCANALRFVLAWRAKDPDMTDAAPTNAELARAARRLPPSWQFDDVTEQCVEMARGALDLIESCAEHPEALEGCAQAMAAPSDSPPVVMVQSAVLLAAAGLEPRSLPGPAHAHEHGKGEPCPDPAKCDCEPCSKAKAAEKPAPVRATRVPVSRAPVWSSLLGRMRRGKTDCATGTCPI